MSFLIAIVIIVLVIDINLYLKGASTNKIISLLFWITLGIISCTFYYHGYKYGIAAIALAIICYFVFMPIAARIAALLFRRSFEGDFPGTPDNFLKKINLLFEQHSSHETFLIKTKNGDYKDLTNEEILVEYCRTNEKTNSVLERYGVTDEALLKIIRDISYLRSQYAGAHYLPVSAVAYPKSLEYILNNGVTEKTVFDLFVYFERGTPLGTMQIVSPKHDDDEYQ